MSEISDFIAQRKATLTVERDRLEAELVPIRSELLEIASVERMTCMALRAGRAAPENETVKGYVLRVLATAGRPLTAAEIRRDIHIHHGRDIDRTTFSPQLSRLVRTGQVLRAGMTYSLLATDPAEDTGR